MARSTTSHLTPSKTSHQTHGRPRSLALVTSLFILLTILSTFTIALPVSPSQPFISFDIIQPEPSTIWVQESLPTVEWETLNLPQGSTVDIAILNHKERSSTLLRRYVPARLGSTMINLKPELLPGEYSLLVTVFNARSSVAMGRSWVKEITIVGNDQEEEDEVPGAEFSKSEWSKKKTTSSDNENEDEDEEEEGEASEQDQHNTILSSPINKWHSRHRTLTTSPQQSPSQQEELSIQHEPKGSSLVMRAPYNVGWSIPKGLRKSVRKAHVNISLVANQGANEQVIRVLNSNVPAEAGFVYIFVPTGTPLGTYRIKIEMVSKNRRFVGYTRRFPVRESGMEALLSK